MKRCEVVTLLILCCTIIPKQGLSQEYSENAEVGLIKAALNKYYASSLSDIYCSFEYNQKYSNNYFEKLKVEPQNDPRYKLQQENKRIVSMWWQSDGKYRYELDEHATYSGTAYNIDHTFANDNKTYSSLLNRRDANPIHARGSLNEYDVQSKLSYPNAIKFGMGIGHVPFDKFFESNKFEFIAKETYEGSQCYLVQVDPPAGARLGVRRKIWFDTEKGFRAPLMQGYDEKGNLLYEMKTKFQKIDEVWFPLYGECKYYETDAERGLVVSKTIEFKLKEGQINKGINPEKFEIHFPPGTLVRNNILGMQYVIPGDEIIDNKFDRYLEMIDLVETNQNNVSKSKTNVVLPKTDSMKIENKEHGLVEKESNDSVANLPSTPNNTASNHVLFLCIGFTILCVMVAVLFCVGYNKKRKAS